MVRMTIPHDPIDNNGTPNSTHWLWDGTVFTVSTMDSVHFWDLCNGKILESIKLRTKIFNHVMATSKYSINKYVAGNFKFYILILLEAYEYTCICMCAFLSTEVNKIFTKKLPPIQNFMECFCKIYQ